ncbi:hypothetical protein RR48_01842 [Papilio machaon]|uniref:Uncharacterized protein n=1 Tax=Papilio machaon TaxID=76193 RepID=A0A0N1IDR7_PAPMA|nr:hypothetical protein RR48_01842 [Papilio machaon]
MSASEPEISESSNLESPSPHSDSPYSSPSQQVPQLANFLTVLSCGDNKFNYDTDVLPIFNRQEKERTEPLRLRVKKRANHHLKSRQRICDSSGIAKFHGHLGVPAASFRPLKKKQKRIFPSSASPPPPNLTSHTSLTKKVERGRGPKLVHWNTLIIV